jgi:hypothetical protein
MGKTAKSSIENSLALPLGSLPRKKEILCKPTKGPHSTSESKVHSLADASGVMILTIHQSCLKSQITP